MNAHEKIFKGSIALSKSIKESYGITDKHRLKWHRLRKLIKKHKCLKSRRHTLKHYPEIADGDMDELQYSIEYYSDRWTRNRMYLVDKLFKELYEFT